MARKTKAEALATRNLLLDAAEKVFYERGVSKTSLADIAKAAEMTRGAIYWHFKNKYDLLQAMMERVRLPPETLLEVPVADAPLQAIRDYAVKMLRDTATNPRRKRVLAILMHRCEKTEDEAKPLTVRQQAAFIDCTSHIRHCLDTAVEQDLLPQRLDTDKATTLFLALVFGLISNWLFLPDNFDLEADAEAMTDAFFPMLQHSPSLLKPPF